MAEEKEVKLNLFHPSRPHAGQQAVLDELDSGTRWVMIRCGRKWRKTSMMISWLMEKAIKTGLACPYIAPNKVQAKNIVWDDHIQRILYHFKEIGFPYKTNEVELSVQFPKLLENGKMSMNGGKLQLFGVENQEALRGISNWGAVGCFPAGTKVLTKYGWKNIEDITTEDIAITPNGEKRITRSGKTKEVKKLISVVLSTGEVLVGTDNHKVFTNNGLTRMDELDYNSVIWTTKYHKQSSLTESSIGYRKENRNTVITDPEDLTEQTTSIMPYIDSTSEKSPKMPLFTMLTGISSTISQKISSVFLLQNTQDFTQMIDGNKKENLCSREQEKISKKLSTLLEQKKAGRCVEEMLRRLLRRPQSGTDQEMERNGTQREERRTGKTGNILKKPAKNVGKNTKQHTQSDLDTVPHVVEIRSLFLKENLPVYNLTVEKDHCYFANGVLVSNCDEYDDWDEDIWPLIIRPNLLTHKAPALIAGTPKGYKNMWRMAQSGVFKEFHYPSYMNPDLDKEELEAMIQEYKDLDPSGGYYRQEIEAEYERPQGTVYAEWSESNWVPFEYDPFLPLHLTFDFGVNDPTAIIWIQPNGGEFRVIDYYETRDASIEHFVSVIRSKPYKRPDLCTGDAAGKARSITTNTSPIEEYGKHGIYIKTKDGLEIPDQVRITHKYVPGLKLAKGKADRLRECILNYRYPEKRSTAVNQSNEIPLHDWSSHGCRALEYYFANIDGGSLFKDYSGVKYQNKAMGKKWQIK